MEIYREVQFLLTQRIGYNFGKIVHFPFLFGNLVLPSVVVASALYSCKFLAGLFCVLFQDFSLLLLPLSYRKVLVVSHRLLPKSSDLFLFIEALSRAVSDTQTDKHSDFRK